DRQATTRRRRGSAASSRQSRACHGRTEASVRYPPLSAPRARSRSVPAQPSHFSFPPRRGYYTARTFVLWRRAVSRPESHMNAPRISFVSLGCPKALVDSERILTQLRAEGYEIARKHDGADLVVVNTCGFLDSARDESLSAIGTALKENGMVIVTG